MFMDPRNVPVSVFILISYSDFNNMNELAPLGNIATNFGYEILPLDEKEIQIW